jgi:hypothetical protein
MTILSQYSLEGGENMGHWKAVLKADPTNWLLEEENPSVRYFTMKDILDKPENDVAVQKARQGIMETGMAREILFRQPLVSASTTINGGRKQDGTPHFKARTNYNSS